MKKDIQDYLLPFVERGDVIMIGITTINPYRAVNPAIRSRASVYKLMPLEASDLEKLVRKAINYYQSFEYNKGFDIDDEAIKYIVTCANGEGRATINMVEASVLFQQAPVHPDEQIPLRMLRAPAEAVLQLNGMPAVEQFEIKRPAVLPE